MNLGKVNREYKDRLFKYIFGNPENVQWTLNLYNLLNGTTHTNPDDISFNTINDAVYMNIKNDISFIMDSTISLYEHQSTFCPNVPTRFLSYIEKLYNRYAQDNKLDLYSTKIQYMPRAKLVCFYNGTKEQPEIKELKLEDLHFPGTERTKYERCGYIDISVMMININFGHNKDLLNKCKPLYEYSFFIDRIRFHVNSLGKKITKRNLRKAIDRAIEDLPKDFLILRFLLANKAEVIAMYILEYDEEKHLQSEREDALTEGLIKGRIEGRKQGQIEGRKQGQINLLVELVNEGTYTIEQASKKAGMTVKEFKKVLANKT